MAITHKGWGGRGGGSRTNQISDEKVLEIRRRYDAGESPKKIGEALGLNPSHVCQIGKRRKKSHVPEEKRDES